MLKLFDALRRVNRARLERRRRTPPSWFGRLMRRVRSKNRERLARRRAQRQLLASLVANDTAVLETLVFLLKTSRAEERARTEAEVVARERLSALDAKIEATAERMIARLAAVEALIAGARADASVPVAAGGGRNVGSDLTSRQDAADGRAAPAKALGVAPAGRF